MAEATLLVALLLSLLGALLLVAAPDAWAAGPNLEGASVLSATKVKVIFDIDVGVSAESVANYTIAPLLLVTGAQRTDGNRSVVLTTSLQLNATLYGVTVSGVRGGGKNDPPMSAPQTVQFIGTLQGLVSSSIAHDDFNRPSGWRTSDTPIAGPWNLVHQDVPTGNTLELVTSPTLVGGLGDRAFKSTVTNTDGEVDNAAVLRSLGGGSEYYTSAYVYIPSGQGWEPDHATGLLRLNQSETLAHARISAFTESASGFTLKANYKSTNNVYRGEQLVATGISYGAWHWFQMRVRNSPATGQPGLVQVWIDGRLRYQQDTRFVANAPITYAEFGIMHNVTIPTGPPSVTITDQARLGTTYQLPSVMVDTTAPQAQITAPTAGQTLRSSSQITMATSDDYDVQRVEFALDGAPLTSDDVPPFATPLNVAALGDGPHTVTARAVDTSGNLTDAEPVAFTVDTTQATVAVDGVTPDPFTPDGDGDADVTTLAFTTAETTTQRVTVRSDGAVVATPLDWTQAPAGSHQVAWDGRLTDGSVAPQGDYTLRVEVRDLFTPALPATQAEANVKLLATLGAVSAAPSPFSPNGDGNNDLLAVDFTLNGTATTEVTVTLPDGTPVATVQPATALGSGGHQATWDGLAGETPAADGGYVVRVVATSAVGTQTKVRDVVLDATAPVTSDDGDGLWHADDVTVALTADDALSGVAAIELAVDDGAFAPGTTVTIVAAADGSADGEHIVSYRSTDLAGNVEELRQSVVRIDTTAPSTTVSGGDADWHSGDVTLELSSSDVHSGVAATEHRIDGGDWIEGSSVTVAGPADGSNDGIHTVEYRSTDVAGNVEAPGVTSVKIGHLDTLGRFVRHRRSLLVVVWPAVPGATVYEVFVDGEPVGTTDATSLTWAAPPGTAGVTFSVEVVARDADSGVLHVTGAEVPWQ